MVDSTIPLTIQEWQEWGNPNEKQFFDYMMSYSPINNIKKSLNTNDSVGYRRQYPACLLSGGLHDPRVAYWEPWKFAAELRHAKGDVKGFTVNETDREQFRPTCVRIDTASGHFATSDRYKYLEHISNDYAFLFGQFGKNILS